MKNYVPTFEIFLGEEKVNEMFFYDSKTDSKKLAKLIKKYKIKIDAEKSSWGEYYDMDMINALFTYYKVKEKPNHYSTDIFRLDNTDFLPPQLEKDLESVGIIIKSR